MIKKWILLRQGLSGVQYCDKLFEIERQIAKLSVPKKQKERNKLSKPIVDEFFKWISKTLKEKIIVNKKLKKALIYAQNQRKELSEFLNDGNIPLSNSLAERCIRPFAIHRKNWLFADTIPGAKANATFYSLIESAKMNKLNIYKYINYLLEELPQKDCLNSEVLKDYLPWSEKLPTDIRNYSEEYEELKIEDEWVKKLIV